MNVHCCWSRMYSPPTPWLHVSLYSSSAFAVNIVGVFLAVDSFGRRWGLQEVVVLWHFKSVLPIWYGSVLEYVATSNWWDCSSVFSHRDSTATVSETPQLFLTHLACPLRHCQVCLGLVVVLWRNIELPGCCKSVKHFDMLSLTSCIRRNCNMYTALKRFHGKFWYVNNIAVQFTSLALFIMNNEREHHHITWWMRIITSSPSSP